MQLCVWSLAALLARLEPGAMTEEVVSYDGGALVSGVEGVEERH